MNWTSIGFKRQNKNSTLNLSFDAHDMNQTLGKGRREKFLIMIGDVGHLEIRILNGKSGLISDGIFNFVQSSKRWTQIEIQILNDYVLKIRFENILTKLKWLIDCSSEREERREHAHITYEAKTARIKFCTLCTFGSIDESFGCHWTFCFHRNLCCHWNYCCHWNFCCHWNLVAIGIPV